MYASEVRGEIDELQLVTARQVVEIVLGPGHPRHRSNALTTAQRQIDHIVCVAVAHGVQALRLAQINQVCERSAVFGSELQAEPVCADTCLAEIAMQNPDRLEPLNHRGGHAT